MAFVTGRAVVLHEHGGTDKLQVVTDFTFPPPGPKQVRIKVAGVGINPVDVYVRMALKSTTGMFRAKSFPLIVGGDASGVVESVGAGAAKVKPGDRVYALSSTYAPQEGLQGTYGEYALLHEDWVAAAPAEAAMPLADAAAVPLVALTAWQALERANLQPGHKLLVTGASGGVGHVAVQLAKLLYPGVRVTGVASAGKAAWVRSLGADDVYDYATPLEAFADAVGRNSYDAVVDLTGGALLDGAVKLLLRKGAAVSVIANGGTDYAALGAWETGGEYAVARTYVAPSGETLAKLAALISDGKLQVNVARRLPLEKAGEAQDLVFDGSGFSHVGGKVVLTL